jgi:hypothetical protein
MAWGLALTRNSTLETLDLSHNRLDSMPAAGSGGPGGAGEKKKSASASKAPDRFDHPWTALAEGIAHNATLKALHLRYRSAAAAATPQLRRTAAAPQLHRGAPQRIS